MKKYAMEGMVAILAVALVLGLAASAFPEDEEKSFWSLTFGGYWGRAWYDEIIPEGGTLFGGESYNTLVDQLEEQFKVIEHEVTDLGGDFEGEPPNKIKGGSDWGVHLQHQWTHNWGWGFGYGRSSADSNGWYLAHYPWGEAWVTETYDKKVKVSYDEYTLALHRNWYLPPHPHWNIQVGVGPSYRTGRLSVLTTLKTDYPLDHTIVVGSLLKGSALGYKGFVKISVEPWEGVCIGGVLGYRTGEIELAEGDEMMRIVPRGPWIAVFLTKGFRRKEELLVLITPQIIQEPGE